jgi:hypothetical protein
MADYKRRKAYPKPTKEKFMVGYPPKVATLVTIEYLESLTKRIDVLTDALADLTAEVEHHEATRLHNYHHKRLRDFVNKAEEVLNDSGNDHAGYLRR